MKPYLLLVICLLGLISCSQKKNGDTGAPLDPIVIGHTDSLFSNILDEPRKLWIHIPESARSSQQDRKYPVLYLLDGPGHFYSVTGMIKQLSTSNGNTILPEMIVVAMPNTNRSRDLTPTNVDTDFFTGDSITYDSGGGDNFLDFIEDELIPHIENTYPAAPYRTFVGHSFGGLSVLHALITRPHVFNNYISIDPSLWWDNMRYKNYADSLLNSGSFDGNTLYVAIANTMDEGMDIHSVQSDTTTGTAHIRSILQFVQSLQKNRSNGLAFDWDYYENDSHGSVPLIAEYDGLRFLFSWHEFKGWDEIVNSAPELSPEELLELPVNHFKQVSERFGYKVLPPEMLINSIAYYLLNNGMPEKASIFFDSNINNYPASSNVYNSRGNCYLTLGDTVKALEYFRKALEIEDIDRYREKIERLKHSMK